MFALTFCEKMDQKMCSFLTFFSAMRDNKIRISYVD